MEENMELDTSNDIEIKTEVIKETPQKVSRLKKVVQDIESTNDTPVSCLSNKKIIVRFLPKDNGLITNPKHIFYGGMGEASIRGYVVPLLSSGQYVNVLTNSEKAYLEEVMGLEENDLSIYLKVNNFWDTFYVRLTKGDNVLDLSNPMDYIKYKVLLANKDFIAPSLTAAQDNYKITYEFVIISEEEEVKRDDLNLSYSMRAYMKLGELISDIDSLKLIVETIEGRPLSPNAKLDFVKVQANKAVQANPKLFLSIAEDTMLPTKVFIKKCIESGIIVKKGNFLYNKADNSPLCEYGEDPTLGNAVKYLNAPKHQEVKFTLEAKLKV